MFQKLSTIFFLAGIILFFSCEKREITNADLEFDLPDHDEEWLIPYDQIKEGGPGKEGIPSLDDPIFQLASENHELSDEDRVVVVRVGTQSLVYPISILNWHEIVNDQLKENYFTVTYCPLTGTSLAWNRKFADEVTSFGISGWLYQNNMITYDRISGSYWQQMLFQCVSGQRMGQLLELLPVLETNWGAIKQLSEVYVLTTPFGYGFDYNFDPYKQYPYDNEYILFPPKHIDPRYPAKEKLFVLFAGERVKAFPVKQFENGLDIISENFSGVKYVLIGDLQNNLVTAYLVPDGRTMTKVDDHFPIVMEDNLGNLYNFMGVIEQGPEKGMVLPQPQSYLSYWFSLSAFFNRITIYE